MIRGYYVNDGDPVIPYPVAEEWPSDAGMVAEDDIEFRAQAGNIEVQKNWTTRVWELNFRITQEERDFFETLHRAVDGRKRPFYFVLDVTGSPLEVVLVRKEREFRPRSLGAVEIEDGSYVRFYEYKQILTEEVDSAVSIEE